MANTLRSSPTRWSTHGLPRSPSHRCMNACRRAAAASGSGRRIERRTAGRAAPGASEGGESSRKRSLLVARCAPLPSEQSVHFLPPHARHTMPSSATDSLQTFVVSGKRPKRSSPPRTRSSLRAARSLARSTCVSSSARCLLLLCSPIACHVPCSRRRAAGRWPLAATDRRQQPLGRQ